LKTESVKSGGLLKNLLLLTCMLIVCALLLEVMARLFIDDGISYELEMWKYARDVKVRDLQPDLGHRHGADRDEKLMRVDVRTNSFGFRGPAIAEKAEPGVARIAFVGDSTTLGWGVAEQDTFAHKVIADLKDRGLKVDGYNLGVGNYNTTQELALFRDVGQRMKPDIIVLTYFINDAEPMPSYSQTSWLDLHSVAWIVLRYRLDSLIRQFAERPDWKKYYRDLYDDSAAGWQATQKALGEFARLSRESGARLLVFHLPELHELKPYAFPDVTDKVRKVIEKQSLPFIDLLPTVENLDPSTLWVTVPDPHPNANANTAFTPGMVQALLPVLADLCRTKEKGCRPNGQ
jgi:hypothetical protein